MRDLSAEPYVCHQETNVHIMPGRSSSSGRPRQIISLLFLKVISSQALQPDSRAAFGIFSQFKEVLKVLQLLTMQ